VMTNWAQYGTQIRIGHRRVIGGSEATEKEMVTPIFGVITCMHITTFNPPSRVRSA
jgi:hypothetical protein